MDLKKTEINNYCNQYTGLLNAEFEALLAELLAEARSLNLNLDMSAGPIVAKTLVFLLQLIQARTVVELGTFIGYSTLVMARSLSEAQIAETQAAETQAAEVQAKSRISPDDANLQAEPKIYTCDTNLQTLTLAKKYFAKSGYNELIIAEHKSAQELLTDLDSAQQNSAQQNQLIDCIFIDADKLAYADYYETSLSLLRPGGLLILDNMLWQGLVLDSELDSKAQAPGGRKFKIAKALHQLNQQIAVDNRVQNLLLPLRDGLQIVRKI